MAYLKKWLRCSSKDSEANKYECKINNTFLSFESLTHVRDAKSVRAFPTTFIRLPCFLPIFQPYEKGNPINKFGHLYSGDAQKDTPIISPTSMFVLFQ